MADHHPSQQLEANHLSENTPSHAILHRVSSHVPVQHVASLTVSLIVVVYPCVYFFKDRHVASDNQQETHRGYPQPVVMRGQMHHPRHIDVPNVAHYHLPPPLAHYPEVPYVPRDMHWDVGVAEPVPAQAHHFAQEFPENRRDDGPHGHGAQFPGADPPEDVPGIWLHPPPAADPDMPANDLKIFARRLINNPDTRVNILRIEPGADGGFEVWITLELGNLF